MIRVPTDRDGDIAPATARWALLAITAVAAILRIIGLNSGLWYDEIVTLVESVRKPLAQLVTAFPSNNNHPFYSLLAHASIHAGGEHPWTLRLPAFVFGVLTIPSAYLLGTAVTARREALIACAILACSYHHVWFSQNARAYTLLGWAAVTCTWLLLRGLDTGKLRWFVGYAFVAAAGAYGHLTMGFLVAAHVLYCAWRWGSSARAGRRRVPLRQALVGFIVAGVLTIAAYAPLVVQVHQFFSRPAVAAAQVATRRWAFLEMLRGLRIGLGMVGAIAAGVVTVAGFIGYVRQRIDIAVLFVLPGMLVVAGTIATRAPIRPRFLFFLSGYAVLILARGITVLSAALARRSSLKGREWGLSFAMVAAFILASVPALVYGYKYPKQDFDGALRYLEATATPRDAVVTTGLAAFPYNHYYERGWPVIATRAQLDAARRTSHAVFLVYTLPEYEIPLEVSAAIREDCQTVANFPGTLGGGDVVVCRVMRSDS
jgi:mannosyltransferase